MNGSAVSRGPLAGIRVLNLATMLGTGHATALLADFGADVVCIELPGRGDSLREMGPFRNHESLRWAVVGRGKLSMTLNLRVPEGQEIARQLAATCDVVVENFRPGTLSRWNLGYEDLRLVNPSIIMLSLSGYGQTGPDSSKPGFGRVIEAVSGLMNSTGMPDGPPVQIGVPIVDYLAGTYGAMAIAMALHARAQTGGSGQYIDLSLYESIVRLSDSLTSGFEARGEAPRRRGNRYSNIAPSDVYSTQDARYVFHSSATQTVYERLMKAIDREDLVHDPRFATNAVRTSRVDEINDIVQDWFSRHTMAEVARIMEEHDVPIGPVNTIEDVLEDPQLLGRSSIVPVDVPGLGQVRMPGVVPKFSATPGSIRHSGPRLGEHTEQILRDDLGYGSDEVERLRAAGVI
jgi:formyl-CoA transferase